MVPSRFLLSPQYVIALVRSLVHASRKQHLLRASAVVALAFGSSSASGQSIPTILDDASVLRRGTMRIDVSFLNGRADERYGLNSAGRTAGSLEPLAADFDILDLGVDQFPGLAPSQQAIRDASGLPGFVLSLGRPSFSSSVTSTTLPLSLDVGVTSRLMIGAVVPYVRTRNNVRTDFNPARSEGNAGINPGLIAGVARTANSQFRDQVTGASSALRAALDACAANPGAPECANLEANRAQAEALIVESRSFRDAVESIYGSDTAVRPALFVPRAGSEAQAAIEQRATEMNSLYRSLLGLAPEAGDPIAARPFAAQTPIAAGQAQALFTDPDQRLGLAVRPPQSVERSHIGDVEVGAKLLLLDTFRPAGSPGLPIRIAVGAAYRFGTGQEDDPDDLFDVPTGDGQDDVDVRGAVDIGMLRRLVTSVRGRHSIQLPDRTVARITEDPSDVFPAAYRRQEVERDLGDIIEVDVLPRYALSDYFAVVGHYLFRRKAEDTFTGRYTIPDETTGIGDIELDASTLTRETGATEHRAGIGFTFSLQPALTGGRMRRPVEVSYLHSRTVRGSGGSQPKWTLDALQVRITTPLFGR